MIRDFLCGTDYLQALLVIGGVFAIWVLWRVHLGKNKLSLTQLITGDDGMLSAAKLFQFGAFLVSSWGFVYLITHDRFAEWYYGLYMGVWAANKLFTQYLNTKALTPQTTSVQVSAPNDQGVNVQVGG